MWRVSVSQAGGLIRSWVEKKQEDGVSSMWHVTMTFALNVLMGAGFGKSVAFDSGDQLRNKNAKVYRDILARVLDNLTLAIISSRISLPEWCLPSILLKTREATSDLKHHMEEMVEEEPASIHRTGVGSDSLMSALLRASKTEDTGDKLMKNGLTDDEILGNLFIYNLAGHDTTANTLAYAVTWLAIEPSVQNWLREEIVSFLGQNKKKSRI